jgi:hypothetical protein
LAEHQSPWGSLALSHWALLVQVHRPWKQGRLAGQGGSQAAMHWLPVQASPELQALPQVPQ